MLNETFRGEVTAHERCEKKREAKRRPKNACLQFQSSAAEFNVRTASSATRFEHTRAAPSPAPRHKRQICWRHFRRPRDIKLITLRWRFMRPWDRYLRAKCMAASYRPKITAMQLRASAVDRRRPSRGDEVFSILMIGQKLGFWLACNHEQRAYILFSHGRKEYNTASRARY